MNKSLIAGFCLAILSGCSSSSHILDSKKVDYKTAASTNNSLDVPPDLTPIQTDDRFAVPGEESSATLSQYNHTQQSSLTSSTDNSAVLPTFGHQVTLEQDRGQRWLVVHQPVEKAWPILEDFWSGNGFTLRTDDPKIGMMETEWTDIPNATPPVGGLGGLVNRLFSNPVRDQFRIRIERLDATHTEIHLFHQRMEEMLNHSTLIGELWQPLPESTEIETEYLRKLAVKFGETHEEADALVTASTQGSDKTTGASVAHSSIDHGAQLSSATDGSPIISMKDSFDRAWRRIGLALDRSAFTVEDRDRATGVYFIRYTTDQENRKKSTGEGFFSKLAFWRSEDKSKDTQTYRLTISSVSGHGTTVDLHNKDDSKANPDTAKRILGLIYNQLR